MKEWFHRLTQWLTKPVLTVGLVSTKSTAIVGGIHTETPAWVDTIRLPEEVEDDCPNFLKSPFSRR